MPIDSSIAMGYQPIKLENPMNSLAQLMQMEGARNQNRLADLQFKQHEQTQEEANALNALYAGSMGPDGKLDRTKLLQGAASRNLGSKIPGLQKGFLETDKAQGEVDKQAFEMFTSAMKVRKDELGSVRTADDAKAWHRANHSNPVTGPMLSKLGVSVGAKDAEIDAAFSTPEGARDWVNKSALGMRDFIEQNKPTYQKTNSGKVEQILAFPGLGGAPTVGSSTQMTTTPGDDLRSKDAALGRGVTIRGQDIGKQTAEARLTFEKNKPVSAKAGPMSVTLQKELLESDDAVQVGKSVVSTLKNALTLNDKAYSGYGAKTRATLASNFGGSESADATINIDNMMTGQGLDQMKSIFGAAPTEGERKILMDMQASADKTPTQRKSIMDRAIAAAERRVKYAEAKAKSIRAGTYLTEGMPTEPSGRSVLDEADAILNGK